MFTNRLNRKTLLFRLLNDEPGLSAQKLQRRAREEGLELGLVAAYRVLRAFRESDGKLEDSDSRCLRIIANLLQDAEQGEHLTASQIRQRALARDYSVHQATVYRVLERLSSIGLVVSFSKGRQKFFEWKREDGHHGHLACMECGKTIEFHSDYLDEIGKKISRRFGYEFDRIEFLVRSICDGCRK